MSHGVSVDNLVKDRAAEGISFCPEMWMNVKVSSIIRGVVLGIFTVVKFIILSILRLGRWCWDRISLV